MIIKLDLKAVNTSCSYDLDLDMYDMVETWKKLTDYEKRQWIADNILDDIEQPWWNIENEKL